MAIFIIDQFSLNTDLPLDIRYVPTTGRFDPDVSIFKYAGMQVFDTNTDTVWYADNSLNWQQFGSGSDASLNDLWSLVYDISTYITNNIDVSINNLYNITNQLDASIIDLRGDIIRIDASLVDIDSSLSILNLWNGRQDASIAALRADHLAIDASIVALRATDVQLDASIVLINQLQGIQDASITGNTADIIQLDASVVLINQLQGIQDASIIANTASLDQLDASVVELRSDVVVLDASIVLINQLQGIQDASITLNALNIVQLDSSIVRIDIELNQIDASIQRLDVSLGDYVKKAGDTMTGPLTITGGGLQVGTAGSPQDVSIYSNLYVHNNTTIGGNLWVDGSLYVTSVETIDVSAAFIHLNTGLTGTPPASMQSGIEIHRGDLNPYVFIFDEDTQTFRIGIAVETSTGYLDSSTQAVATREDNPVTDGVAYWNNVEDRFDTSAGLIFDGNIFTLDASLYLSQLAQGTNQMLVVTTTGEVVPQAIPDLTGYATIAYVDGSLQLRDASITVLYNENDTQNILIGALDASIVLINQLQGIQDASITLNALNISQNDASIVIIYATLNQLDASIQRIDVELNQIDASLIRIDGSITNLYSLIIDPSVKGAINIGDASAYVYAGLSVDGSLQFRGLTGANGVNVYQSGDVISIEIDSSFSGGEINTASNIGTGEGLSVTKVGVDLPFKSIDTNQPSQVILSSDSSTMYIDVSISVLSEASLGGLTDVAITPPLDVHQIIEWDSDVSKWVNTNNIVWDISLGTTTDDLGGIPAGTDLEGQTLKQILYKILYEYQVPLLSTSTSPVNGTYEKGLISTQFADISINWNAANTNYPLALLNNIHITKTGAGSIYDASLGLVASSIGGINDGTGITNWGTPNRTISYNVTIDDNTTESQPAVGSSKSFTFYYRQYWGMVAGTTIASQVNSAMIKGLIDSRLAGETTLNATFDNSTGGFVKYLFAYPDTVASPDNFGVLTQILDQNDFDITGSWDTENEDVSIGLNNVRYRFYLAKNKVNTADFDISFIF